MTACVSLGKELPENCRRFGPQLQGGVLRVWSQHLNLAHLAWILPQIPDNLLLARNTRAYRRSSNTQDTEFEKGTIPVVGSDADPCDNATKATTANTDAVWPLCRFTSHKLLHPKLINQLNALRLAHTAPLPLAQRRTFRTSMMNIMRIIATHRKQRQKKKALFFYVRSACYSCRTPFSTLSAVSVTL